jgi:hypothetical protein
MFVSLFAMKAKFIDTMPSSKPASYADKPNGFNNPVNNVNSKSMTASYKPNPKSLNASGKLNGNSVISYIKQNGVQKEGDLLTNGMNAVTSDLSAKHLVYDFNKQNGFLINTNS